MRLDEWIHTWHRDRIGYRELYSYAETVDTIFVRICSLLSREYQWMKEDSHISSFCVEMEKNVPVFLYGVDQSQKTWDLGKNFEPTIMFSMGLLLYELLYGKEKLESQLQRAQEKTKTQKSLIMGVELDNVYQEFDDIIEQMTRFDKRERTQDLYELPSCYFKLEMVEEKTGEVINTVQGLLDDFDETYQIRQSFKTEKGEYMAVPGQKMEIGYSFLYKKYVIKYTRVRRHVMNHEIQNGIFGIEACRKNGEKIFFPLSQYNENTWRAKLAIPTGSYVPYISIALSLQNTEGYQEKCYRYPQIYLEPLPDNAEYCQLDLKVDVSELAQKNRLHVSAELLPENEEGEGYQFASQTLDLGF